MEIKVKVTVEYTVSVRPRHGKAMDLPSIRNLIEEKKNTLRLERDLLNYPGGELAVGEGIPQPSTTVADYEVTNRKETTREVLS